MYTITSLCRLTGVNSLRPSGRGAPLRFPKATRAENGRRIYSLDEARQVSLVARLLAAATPSATLSTSRRRFCATSATRCPPCSRPRISASIASGSKPPLSRRTIRRYASASAKPCKLLPPVDAVADVIAPMVRTIGEAWAAGKIAIHEEHIVTAIVRQALFAAAASGSWRRPDPPSSSRRRHRSCTRSGCCWMASRHRNGFRRRLSRARSARRPDRRRREDAARRRGRRLGRPMRRGRGDHANRRRSRRRASAACGALDGAPATHGVHGLGPEANCRSFADFRSFHEALQTQSREKRA